MIKDFELSNPKRKYKSDFEVFLRESKLEDFVSGSVDTIIVSTIHKAKGKEFDNVYLMLNDFRINEESKKRELYVAMTRAKNNLTIHLNNNILNGLDVEDLSLKTDTDDYSARETLVLQLTHRDIWLGFFNNNSRQELIKKLQCGDKLIYRDNICYNSGNQEIIKFSKAFFSKLDELRNKDYEISDVKVNFIVFWKAEETGKEIKVVLPEIYLT